MSSKNKKVPKTITSEELDRRFDEGEDMADFMDLENASKAILIEFPLWMVKELDDEAARLGVARQAVIKMLLDSQLEVLRERREAVKRLMSAASTASLDKSMIKKAQRGAKRDVG